jgi:hypothetical protein
LPAAKLNYILVYKNHSQLYGCSSKKIAIDSPPPEGCSESDKNVFFVTFEPDTDNISIHKVNNEEEVK